MIFSKRFPQFWHRYSKMGIGNIIHTVIVRLKPDTAYCCSSAGLSGLPHTCIKIPVADSPVEACTALTYNSTCAR
jgi:hypothetical protein